MTKMLNVRVEQDLAEAIDRAAEDHGVSRSMWMREVLAKAVVGVEEPHPARTLALQKQRRLQVEERTHCTHPPGARKQLPFSEVCTLCGVTVRETS